MVLPFVDLQMCMHSPLFGLQTCFLGVFFCLKLPPGLYYMSASSNGSGDTALLHRLA